MMRPTPRVPSLGSRLGATKPVLVALIAVALGLVAWFAKDLFLDSSSTSAASGAPGATGPGAVRPGQGDAELLRPGDEPLAVGPGGTSADGGRSASPSSGRTEAVRAGSVFVEGRVVLPEGTPLDEEVFVESREKGGLGTPRDRDQIDSTGKFRVAFSEDTSVGWLRVAGRYVWYPGSLSVRPGRAADEEIEMEPVLGGRVEGDLIVADGAALPGGELEVRLEGSPDDGGHWRRMRQVEFEVRRQDSGYAARFEGNALPPGLYRLECTPDGYLSKVVEEFRVSPGETEIVDLDLVPVPTLSGVVLDPEGEPVAEAEVTARAKDDDGELSRERREDETDENGRFVLRGVAPGEVEIDVSAEGFTDLEEELVVQMGDANPDLSFTLSYGGTLSGRVVYPDGEGAPGARVTAKSPEGVGMRSSFRSDASTSVETDEDGRFFLSALDEGPYELLSSTPKPDGEGYFVARLEDVEVNSDDVLLTLGPGYKLSGRVVDLAGEPVKRYALSVRPEGTFAFMMDPESVGIMSQRVRDPEGRFFVDGLLPGDWTLKVVAGGYGEVEKTTLTLPPSPGELVIQVFELSTLKGVVYGPDGKPVPKARVTYRVVEGGLDMSTFGQKNTDRRGRFRFGGVAPGTLKINASADGYAPAPELEISVGREQDLDDLELTLGLGARIEGTVSRSDGGPVSEARVSWNNSERGKNGSTRVGEDGTFKITGVPSGKVELSARIEFKSASGLSRGTRRVTAERVLADGDVWTPVLRDEAKPLRPTQVEVTRNGSPWGGVEVSLSGRGDNAGWNIRGDTDASGVAELELPGTGDYGFGLETRSGTIRGNCTVDGSGTLEFDLSLGGVEGKVVQPDGVTLLFAQVQLMPVDHDKGSIHLRSQEIEVDDEGNFEAEDILAGTYRILATGPSLEDGMRQSPPQEVEITRGSTTGPLELQLSETVEGDAFGDFFDD